MEINELKIARWWQEGARDKIRCTLCPRYCKIGPGQHGFCFVRKNIDGKLYSIGYGRPTGFALDPIEKKPLFHFLPGSTILSFGTAGCNLGCQFCQNWTTSKAQLNEVNAIFASPEDVVALAQRHHAPSIAITYNEPTIIGEYVADIAKLAKAEGIHSVMVTNGYIDKEARKQVYQDIAAANVDLKGFTEQFYRKLTFSHLADVLDTLVWLKNETAVWFEITTLLIPGENDSDDEIRRLCDWILAHLGAEIPLHFSAFHPDYKMLNTPRTPPATLLQARKIAIAAGIKHCYLGNIQDSDGQTTFCPHCHTELIRRGWQTIKSSQLKSGCCGRCGAKIAGFWL